MIKKETLKGLLVGVILTVLLTSTVFAAGLNIEVFYGTVKRIIIDGEDKTPTEEKDKPFVYNGTTYLPIRYVAESLGKSVEWDGSMGTIYIGERLDKSYKEVYLYDKPSSDIADKKIKVSEEDKGYVFGDLYGIKEDQRLFVTYNTNGQAKELRFDISMKALEGWGARVKVFDESGSELYNSGVFMDGQTETVSIPIESSLKVTIEVSREKSGKGSMLTCAEVLISDLRILTQDY
jgi:hypothetical protein